VDSGGFTHLPDSQMRSPLQSVSFEHSAAAGAAHAITVNTEETNRRFFMDASQGAVSKLAQEG
jgi:hypothetical protein